MTDVGLPWCVCDIVIDDNSHSHEDSNSRSNEGVLSVKRPLSSKLLLSLRRALKKRGLKKNFIFFEENLDEEQTNIRIKLCL